MALLELTEGDSVFTTATVPWRHCLIHIIDGESKAQLVFLRQTGLMDPHARGASFLEASSELPRVHEPPLIGRSMLLEYLMKRASHWIHKAQN